MHAMSTFDDRLQEPLQIHPMNAWRRVDDHVFVLTEADEFLTIDDPVGLVIWSALDERPRTITLLVDHLLEAFDVERDVLQADLLEFLDTLVSHGALTFTSDLSPKA
jgi:hypothetical protein